MRCRLTIAVIVLLSARLLAATPVSGVVFLDKNENGSLDPDESGLAGVPISDGVKFVLTDESGKYSMGAEIDVGLLKGDKSPILTATFPSGYWPTTPFARKLADENDLANIHFGLRKDEQSLPFVFIHGTDPHLTSAVKQKFAAFREDVRRMTFRPRFCILTGDIVKRSDSDSPQGARSDFELAAECIKGCPIPVFSVPGNHDAAGVGAVAGWDKNDPMYGCGMYWHYIGPLRWSFNYGGCHFVGIDFNDASGGAWKWGVPASAVAWLRKDLALVEKGARIFLFVHYPLSAAGIEGVVKEFGVTQIFCGHSHGDSAFEFGGVPALLGGSLNVVGGDRSPGYRIVEVAPDDLNTFYKAAGDSHAIALDYPRTASMLKPGESIRGAFYDPDSEIKTLKITLSGLGGEYPFPRNRICSRFDAPIDFSTLPSGFRKLVVALSDGKDAWSYQADYLVMTDHEREFAAAQDAELCLQIAGIDVGGDLKINGELLKELGPTSVRGDQFSPRIRGADAVRIIIPAGQLKCLNTLEFECARRPDGRPDIFCVLDLWMNYDGRKYRDVRVPVGARGFRLVTTKMLYYVDLMPD